MHRGKRKTDLQQSHALSGFGPAYLITHLFTDILFVSFFFGVRHLPISFGLFLSLFSFLLFSLSGKVGGWVDGSVPSFNIDTQVENFTLGKKRGEQQRKSSK